MGDANDKNDPIDFGDLDWDSALDEWDKSTFLPEVAPEAPSSKALVAATPGPSGGEVVVPAISQPGPHLRGPSPPPVAPPSHTGLARPRRPAAGAPRPVVPAPSSSAAVLPKSDDRRRPNLPPKRSSPSAPKVGETGQHTGGSRLVPALPGLDLDDHADSALVASALPVVDLELDDDAVPHASEPPISIEVDHDPRAIEIAAGRGPAEGRTSDDEFPRFPLASVPAHGTSLEDLAERAAWLEEEARLAGQADRSSALLVTVSELYSLAGDAGRAEACSRDAYALGPGHPMASRQARALAAMGSDETRAALAREAENAPTPAARLHAALLAADLARVGGEPTSGAVTWTKARALDPADVRAVTSELAEALARGTSAEVDLAPLDAPELRALRDAFRGAVDGRREGPRPTTERDDVGDLLGDTLRALRDVATAGAPEGVARASQRLANGGDSAFREAALWLTSAFDDTGAGLEATKALAAQGHGSALRRLAGRALLLSDTGAVGDALGAATDDSAFSTVERAVLAELGGLELGTFGFLEDEGPAVRPLARALASVHGLRAPLAPSRASRGDREELLEIGRELAHERATPDLSTAVRAMQEGGPPQLAAVELALSHRAGRLPDLARALGAIVQDEGPAVRIVQAILAEKSGISEDAVRAWQAVREEASELATRTLASRVRAELDPTINLDAELGELADTAPTETAESCALRLELFTRDPERITEPQLRSVERSLGETGLATFMAERAASHRGDTRAVRRWIALRRESALSPFEQAVEYLREANLSPDTADETRLVAEAYALAPKDLTLRERVELLRLTTPTDDAAFREGRAESASGPRRVALLLESALGYLGARDFHAAIRAAKAAEESGETTIARALRARAELAVGIVVSQTEELIAEAKAAETDDERREVYEHLATIDPEPTGALGWHRAILADTPGSLTSLRFVERALTSAGRDEGLGPIAREIADALRDETDPEHHAHVALAGVLAERFPDSSDRDVALDRLRASALREGTSLWVLRLAAADAKKHRDDATLARVSRELAKRAGRASDKAHLLIAASEADARAGRSGEARACLEEAREHAPESIVVWESLVAAYEHADDPGGLARALDGVSRTTAQPSRKLEAAYDAALLWLEKGDAARATASFEHCAEADLGFRETFDHLTSLYAQAGRNADQMGLVERRIAQATDRLERITLEVRLAKLLVEDGDRERAKATLSAALAEAPDHPTALQVMAELCMQSADFGAAEQAFVRLARLLTTPADQRAVYETLGDLYATQLDQPARAQLAFKEVLKRAPGDVATIEKLITVCLRQGDAAQAALLQQELLNVAAPGERMGRQFELARIHEQGGDLRRAEQIFETIRREHPTSVPALRALSEFYGRHHQLPAMHIVLDRTAADVRRALAGGRFEPALFELLRAALALRDRPQGAQITHSTWAALRGKPEGALPGAHARAMDPRLEDLLAPDLAGEALRSLLVHTGEALDATVPVDLRALKATALPARTELASTIGSIATVVGLGSLQVFVSPLIGRTAVPLSSKPPMLLVGEALTREPDKSAQAFVIARALKLIVVRASAFLRGDRADAQCLAVALFSTLKAPLRAEGVDPKRVAELTKRLTSALPRKLDPTVGTWALEAASALSASGIPLRHVVDQWACRAALLAVGDLGAALTALAWLDGRDGLPASPDERLAFAAKSQEAREVVSFAVSDAYAEARARLGLTC